MAAFDPVGAIAAVEGPALHIPDGFVSAPVAAAGWVATTAIVGARPDLLAEPARAGA